MFVERQEKGSKECEFHKQTETQFPSEGGCILGWNVYDVKLEQAMLLL